MVRDWRSRYSIDSERSQASHPNVQNRLFSLMHAPKLTPVTSQETGDDRPERDCDVVTICLKRKTSKSL